MKYVAKITVDGGEVPSVCMRTRWFGKKPVLTIRDTDDMNWSEECKKFDGPGYARNFLGWNLDYIYSMKSGEVSLLRYIDSVESELVKGRPAITEPYDECETITMRGLLGVRRVTPNARTVLYDISGDGYLATREGNCAVHFRGWTKEFTAMSLYDVLLRLCQLSRTNILTYDKIVCYSSIINCRTVIRLKHNVEADRFFAKMYVLGVGHFYALCG